MVDFASSEDLATLRVFYFVIARRQRLRNGSKPRSPLFGGQ